jgi:hypothetical protein
LFFEAASNQSDRSLFAQALQQFYNGEAHPPDPRTTPPPIIVLLGYLAQGQAATRAVTAVW